MKNNEKPRGLCGTMCKKKRQRVLHTQREREREGKNAEMNGAHTHTVLDIHRNRSI